MNKFTFTDEVPSQFENGRLVTLHCEIALSWSAESRYWTLKYGFSDIGHNWNERFFYFAPDAEKFIFEFLAVC